MTGIGTIVVTIAAMLGLFIFFPVGKALLAQALRPLLRPTDTVLIDAGSTQPETINKWNELPVGSPAIRAIMNRRGFPTGK